MISVKHLQHQLQSVDSEVAILKEINFSIENGQSVAITGSSGSGKTTLLGLLAGLDIPSSGEIFINEQNICLMNEDQRALFRAQNVGVVFQSFHLLDGLSALENVLLPLELSNSDNALEKATFFLEEVGLSHRLHHLPSQLSGGEQQRVAIARAFAAEPKYLFADEPTGNLDKTTGANIIDLLFSLNKKQQTTLILVTHEQRLADLCQRQFLMDDGNLSELSQVCL